MNVKERRKALFTALSTKLLNKNLIVIDNISLKEIATKNMANLLKVIPFKDKALLALPKKNTIIEKSSSNLPELKTVLVNYLNIKDILKYKTLIILKDSLVQLDELAK
jgi:large subunit ribosomal protein L4